MSPKDDRRKQKTIAYHTRELQDIESRKASGEREVLPKFREGDLILDVGCGAGQTLIIMGSCQGSVGLDVDKIALELGRIWKPDQKFICAKAESLPFASGSFDLVYSRVSLEYTDIPVVLSEVARVLKPGGKFWTMLVPFRTLRKVYLYDFNWKRIGAFVLVTINGLILHFFHHPLKLPKSGFETFQTQGGFQYLLKASGFVDIKFEHDGTLIASANKPGGPS